MRCEICNNAEGKRQARAMNGLPMGVWACEHCRDRVRHCDLGITIEDGGILLHIAGIDGRGQHHPRWFFGDSANG